MNLAREEQKGAKEEEKEYRPGEIGVVHDVLVDVSEGVQNRQGLPRFVSVESTCSNGRGSAAANIPSFECVQNSHPALPAEGARRHTLR